MAFHLSDYKGLIDKLAKIPGRDWLTITEATKSLQANDGLLCNANVMRHDVDRSPENALHMARLEANNNIKATYYFRCNKRGLFPERYVLAISELNHEVGYHYECLSRSRGDLKAALESFAENLERFRGIAPCQSVAMHGAPLSPYHNQDLLVGTNLRDYNLVSDAVLSFAKTELVYLTDTGGSWRAPEVLNLRDRVGVATTKPETPETVSFGQWVAKNNQLLIVSTHPERWAYNTPNFLIAEGRDRLTNAAKLIISRLRKA